MPNVSEMYHRILKHLEWFLFKDQIIQERILDHHFSLIGKYDTPEFKALPHIKKIDTILQDEIIPGLYEMDYPPRQSK